MNSMRNLSFLILIILFIGCLQQSTDSNKRSNNTTDSVLTNQGTADNNLSDKEKQLLGLWTNYTGDLTKTLTGLILFVRYNNNHSADVLIVNFPFKIRYNEQWEITDQNELYEKFIKYFDSSDASSILSTKIPEQSSANIMSLSNRVLSLEGNGNFLKLFRIDDNEKLKSIFLEAFKKVTKTDSTNVNDEIARNIYNDSLKMAQKSSMPNDIYYENKDSIAKYAKQKTFSGFLTPNTDTNNGQGLHVIFFDHKLLFHIGSWHHGSAAINPCESSLCGFAHKIEENKWDFFYKNAADMVFQLKDSTFEVTENLSVANFHELNCSYWGKYIKVRK